MTRIWTTIGDKRRRGSETPEQTEGRERQRLQDYRTVFGCPAGQAVLADILQRCGLMQTSYQPGNPHATSFQEGKRRVGLELIETINRDPEAVARLLSSGQTEGLFDE